MNILHLSDTHGAHRSLGRLPEADMIVHSGDISMNGSSSEALDFMRWFSALPYAHKIFVAGNHDACLYGAVIDGRDSNCHKPVDFRLRVSFCLAVDNTYMFPRFQYTTCLNIRKCRIALKPSLPAFLRSNVNLLSSYKDSQIHHYANIIPSSSSSSTFSLAVVAVDVILPVVCALHQALTIFLLNLELNISHAVSGI